MPEITLFIWNKINFLISKDFIISRYDHYEMSLKLSHYNILKLHFFKIERFSLPILKQLEMIKNKTEMLFSLKTTSTIDFDW